MIVLKSRSSGAWLILWSVLIARTGVGWACAPTNTCAGVSSLPLTEPFNDLSQIQSIVPQNSALFNNVAAGNEGNFGLTDNAGGGNFGSDPTTNPQNLFTGFDGLYLNGANLDGSTLGTSESRTVRWIDRSIDGLTEALTFSVRLAADVLDTGNGDIWEPADQIQFYYQINGGAATPILWFQGGGGDGSTLMRDTNFDGTPDGTALSPTPQTFTESISLPAAENGVLCNRISIFALFSSSEIIEAFGVDDLSLTSAE